MKVSGFGPVLCGVSKNASPPASPNPEIHNLCLTRPRPEWSTYPDADHNHSYEVDDNHGDVSGSQRQLGGVGGRTGGEAAGAGG